MSWHIFYLQFSDAGVSFSICLCPGVLCKQSVLLNLTSHKVLGQFQDMVVYPDTGPQILYHNGDSCPGKTKLFPV